MCLTPYCKIHRANFSSSARQYAIFIIKIFKYISHYLLNSCCTKPPKWPPALPPSPGLPKPHLNPTTKRDLQDPALTLWVVSVLIGQCPDVPVVKYFQCYLWKKKIKATREGPWFASNLQVVFDREWLSIKELFRILYLFSCSESFRDKAKIWPMFSDYELLLFNKSEHPNNCA